jgi:hypothetical protein
MLGDAEAEAVRAHLATGCPECLRDVFTRPVGLRRAPTVVVERVSGRVLAAVGLAVAAVIASVAVIVGMVRVPPRPGDSAIEKLAGELERLRIERERADATARDRLARLEAQIVEAERRATTGSGPSDRGATDDAAGDREAVPKWLEDLLSTPGARVVPLGAAASAPGARGYAVWSPVRSLVVVSAADLPTGTREPVYRVRVTMNDGSTVWLGDLSASDRRALLVTVPLPEPAGRRVRGVDLYRDPPGAPILTARLRP